MDPATMAGSTPEGETKDCVRIVNNARPVGDFWTPARPYNEELVLTSDCLPTTAFRRYQCHPHYPVYIGSEI